MDQRTNKEKPSVEIADIIREHIDTYQQTYPLFPEQYKIVYDLLNCRTEYLGGHIEQCGYCGSERIMYNSCRNRHCPKCQNMPREQWLEARKAEILPTIYFHNVFTLPHEMNPIILCNKKIMLNILFKSASETLLTFGQNPKNGLGGKMGFIAILHTWDQKLLDHFHLHCLIPGGAVAEDGTRWISCKNEYLFNEEALGLVFRGKFVDYMTRAYHSGKLRFPGRSEPCKTQQGFQQLKDDLYSNKWVVSVRESIKRPEYVLEYLGRYTHRVAISNHRIVSLKDAMVTFKYKNRKTNRMEKMTIKAVEFIRRFLLHALPKNFVRIRHYGFLANRNRIKNLEKIRRLNAMPESQQAVAKSVEEMMLKLTGIDITICPCCKKGKMRIVAEIPMYTGICANEIIRPPN
ncbi:MAG TPA: IS91 family transposase [Desulfobacterales bacterium]|nr:IS91 family transposase [Desulfobacterales bacterium]